MVLYLIGLGLADERDITLRGLEALKKCGKVYLEAYTSILTVGKERLEEAYGVKIEIADREMVEGGFDEVLAGGCAEGVALLVVGDPFGATTHADLMLRAKQLGIPVEVVHNVSIMNAIGCCGLSLYRYGETISIPYFTETWKPDSFYDRIVSNKKAGLHTLCLVDIKVKEPTLESLARGKPVYMPPRFMTVKEALEQLLEIEAIRKEGACTSESMCIGVARVGCADQQIVAGTAAELLKVDFGAPLHSLVLVGEAHPLELELLECFGVAVST
jgi:diphthine synthase